MKKNTQDPHAELERLNADAVAGVPQQETETSSNEAGIIAHRKAAEEGKKQRAKDVTARKAKWEKHAAARRARQAEITSPEGDNA